MYIITCLFKRISHFLPSNILFFLKYSSSNTHGLDVCLLALYNLEKTNFLESSCSYISHQKVLFNDVYLADSRLTRVST